MRKKYNSAGLDSDTTYPVAPAAQYWLTIKSVTDTKNGEQWKTKNGDDYVSVECEIDDAGDWLGHKIWYGVWFAEDKSRPGAGMAIHFLKCLGEPWENEFEIDTDNWIGKRFKAMLKIGKDQNNKPKNEVAYVIDASVDADEVPF